MAQDIKLTGFIIKTQDLGEADILLTFFSKEEGKVRVLAKSAKKMTSKLSGRLQPFAEIELTLVGNTSLAKIIRVETIQQFPSLIAGQSQMHSLLVLQELVTRSLADGQINEPLYELYQKSLLKLSNAPEDKVIIFVTDMFVQALLALGFAPQPVSKVVLNTQTKIFFSNQTGKFTQEFTNSEEREVSHGSYNLYCQFYKNSNTDINTIDIAASRQLLEILNNFTGYQIERELKASRYFLS